jgi:superfamily II DNA or RNA helicase
MGPRRRKLKSHQQRVVDFLLEHRGVIALHSTGSGKTLTAVASAKALLARGTVTHTIALVNKSAIEQFWDEVRMVDPKLEDKFTIVTPATFVRNVEAYNLSTCLLVVDEAHQFANAAGARAKIVIEAAKACPRVLLLTGTLVRNGTADIHPLIAMVRGEDPMDQGKFALMRPAARRTYLKDAISVHLVDKNTDDRYPKLKERVVRIPAFTSTSEGIGEDGGDNAFLAMQRRYGMGSCPEGSKLSNAALRECCEKCGWIIDRLRGWTRRNERVVLFSTMVDTGARTLQRMMVNAGVDCRTIDGTTPAGLRRKYVESFNRRRAPGERSEVPVFIITAAGAESIDLKRVRHVVFLNSVWTWAAETQIVGRAQRYDSHADLPPSQRNVTVWKLQLVGDGYGETTADQAMDAVAQAKRDMTGDLYKLFQSVSVTG